MRKAKMNEYKTLKLFQLVSFIENYNLKAKKIPTKVGIQIYKIFYFLILIMRL